MIEFDLQCPVLGADRYRTVEAAVFDPEIVEHAERFSGEPSQFVVVPFAFEFADHDEWQYHVVFGESSDSPWIGQ